jgi:biopolymer transport protein TolR
MTRMRKRGRRLIGEINVVPYIDVMLVLLIIFMVTAPMLSQGVKVDLPRAAAEPIQPERFEPLLLSVDAAGQMYLNLGDPQRALGAERVLELASAALRREPGRPVLVKADRAVPYGRVMEGMVLLQRAGARKVGFVTQPVSLERKSDAR